jgi:hypothetical protein
MAAKKKKVKEKKEDDVKPGENIEKIEEDLEKDIAKQQKKEEPEKKESKKDKEQEKKDLEKQIKHQNNILKGILVILGVIILGIIAWVVISKNVSTFEYKDLEFEIVQEGDLIFYRTGLPTMYQGQLTEYSFYLRNDARKLDEKVPFQGVLDLKSQAVLNLENEFNCEGKGVIAVANLLKLYQFIGIEVMADQNATCDEEARYTYIEIVEGEETKIETTGQSCYTIYINDCEILEGTERMMIETLNKVRSVTADYK